MNAPSAPAVAVGPPGVRPWLVEAVEAGGGRVVPVEEARALVWASPEQAAELKDALARNPAVEWVQLPWAGVEPLAGLFDHDRIWTSGKGVYADPVAEHAVGLALAGMRHIGAYARTHSWSGPEGQNLLDATVLVLGGGAITEVLLGLLAPFRCRVTVVRKRPDPMPGAAAVAGPEHLDSLLPDADLVVLALALTPETEHIIGAAQLELMKPTAWLVNVARGRHVDTDALVDALAADAIGGAALDVTEPEPLPDGHPLWAAPNCIITPHIGNTPEMAVPLLSARVTENVRRFGAGEPLLGVVDPDLGY